MKKVVKKGIIIQAAKFETLNYKLGGNLVLTTALKT